MKVKDGYILREIVGNYVIVPTGSRVVEFNGLLSLSESAAYLWNILANETDTDELVSAILNEYNIDETTAKADVEEFLNVLEAKGVLEK